MIDWVPIKFPLLSYWNNPENPLNVTFRLIWFTSHEMIGLMGMFSIILAFFFQLDMILTWRNPLFYISA